MAQRLLYYLRHPPWCRQGTPVSSGWRGFSFFGRKLERCIFLYDGFNVYHSVDDLRTSPSVPGLKAKYQFPENTQLTKLPHLKWLNLAAVSHRLILPKSQRIEAIYYFSAYAHWLPGSEARHREFVKALAAVGVKAVMGTFKKKYIDGKAHHEEKESDVALGSYLVDLAYKNAFDTAYIVARDSDYVPAIKLVRAAFPKKNIIVVAPPGRSHLNEVTAVATGIRSIMPNWLQSCLFDAVVYDSKGNMAANRPPEYDPPL